MRKFWEIICLKPFRFFSVSLVVLDDRRRFAGASVTMRCAILLRKGIEYIKALKTFGQDLS